MQKNKQGGVLAATILGLAVFLGAGCSMLGYRVGNSLPPGINVVHVPSFENKTTEPQLELYTTQATISELQREGSLMVGDLGKSDVVLHVDLVDLTLQPLRYEADAATTTSEYRLTIRAELRLVERSTDKVLAKNTVKGETDFSPSGDLSTAKRDALPRASDDLAHQIVKSIVEFW